MVQFGEFLKTWNLRSNIVTRQVSFLMDKNWWKMPKFINSNANCWVIFKQRVIGFLRLWAQFGKTNQTVMSMWAQFGKKLCFPCTKSRFQEGGILHKSYNCSSRKSPEKTRKLKQARYNNIILYSIVKDLLLLLQIA